MADGSRRTLLVDGLEASVVDLADPLELELPYMRWIAGVLVTASLPTSQLRYGVQQVTAPLVGHVTHALDVLHLGGGACTLARWLAAARAGSRSRVFEIDAEIVALARRELGLDQVPGLRVSTADARAGVAFCARARSTPPSRTCSSARACPTTSARSRRWPTSAASCAPAARTSPTSSTRRHCAALAARSPRSPRSSGR
ncbi:MAG: hypothetical protein R2736_02980 [Solirubrobacterales bacterium]